jgi:hypothetical protein
MVRRTKSIKQRAIGAAPAQNPIFMGFRREANLARAAMRDDQIAAQDDIASGAASPVLR